MEKRDIYFMERALCLAQKAKGKTSPNPLVGAVLVKENKIIAEGFHQGCGLDHAEKKVLKSAGDKAKKATLYTTLEPCFHFGKTPPCVDEIIKSGLTRVVTATKDPNPLVYGKSLKKLRKNKIDVTIGVCRKEAKKVNEVFFKNMEKKIPFVVGKVAESLDGKITAAQGQSKWITSKPARVASRRLRDNYDAVLIGAGTLRKDNPRLNGLRKIPRKIVISSSLNLPRKSFLFKEFASSLIVFTSQRHSGKNKLPAEARTFYLKETKKGLPLKKILNILYSLGIMSVFVEGGSLTLGKFFEQRLVDKVYFFIAPKIIGGKDSLTAVGAAGFKQISKSIELKGLKIGKIGKDILIQGYPQ